MLIPRQTNIQEIYQLSVEDRLLLTEEINALSLLMVNYFKPQKINVGALGNIVAQLHIHVVGRNKHDPLWPHSIWQSSFIPTPYSTMEWETLVAELTAWVNSVEFA